jgi:Leucine-rich repeat (LRR) protein
MQRTLFFNNQCQLMETSRLIQINCIRVNRTLNILPFIDRDFWSSIDKPILLRVSGRNITILPNFIYDQSKLETLDLTENLIQTLQYDSFSGVRSLKILDLSSNKLKSFMAESLNLFTFTELERLNLADNNIEKISFRSDYLCNLTELLLLDNKLTVIEDYVFLNLTNLISLNMRNNKISVIKRNGFDGLSNLLRLFLSENSLNFIRANLFSKLINLTNLVLNLNSILFLEDLAFNGLTNLRFLYLSINNISFVSRNKFIGLNSLKAFYIFNNNITEILPNAFSTMRNLELLYLNQEVPRERLSRFNQNFVQHIHENGFNGLVTIREIYMAVDQLNLTHLCNIKNSLVLNQVRQINTQVFYQSININTRRTEIDCNYQFFFIRYNIHLNIKRDSEFFLFYASCFENFALENLSIGTHVC